MYVLGSHFRLKHCKNILEFEMRCHPNGVTLYSTTSPQHPLFGGQEGNRNYVKSTLNYPKDMCQSALDNSKSLKSYGVRRNVYTTPCIRILCVKTIEVSQTITFKFRINIVYSGIGGNLFVVLA